MRGLRPALVVVVWLVLVVGCSSAVWAVIRGAGREVTAEPDIPVTSALVTAGSASSAATPEPVRHPRPHGAASSRRPHPSPTTGPMLTPPAPSAPSQPAPATRAPAPSQPVASTPPLTVEGSWQGPPGSVVAACAGARISLRGAQANSGWHVQVEDRGPQQLHVHFERTEDSTEFDLVAVCSQGAPRFANSSGD